MSVIKCEICGSEEFVKSDGFFVCQGCGLKFTATEVKKLLESDKQCPNCNATLEGKAKNCEKCGYIFVEQTAGFSTADVSFFEKIHFPTILIFLPAVLFAVFSLLLFAFYAAPLALMLGESIGNIYDMAKGGELMEGMRGYGVSFVCIAVGMSIFALGYLAFLIFFKERKRVSDSVFLDQILDGVTLALYLLLFIFGCVVSGKIREQELESGSFVKLLIVFSIVFLVLGSVTLALQWTSIGQIKIKTKEQVLQARSVKEKNVNIYTATSVENIKNGDVSTHGSRFIGGAFANFWIETLSVIATIVSLVFLYPVTVCWKLRWKTKNTYVNGKRLVFDGKGAGLFGKFVLWLFLSVITFGVYFVLAMPLNVKRWQLKHTHFENVRGESKFDGSIWGLFGVNFVSGAVTVLTLGIGSFWAHCYRVRWYAKHEIIDGCRMRFDGTGTQYFGKCIVWMLLTVVTLGVYSLWKNVKQENWTVSHKSVQNLETFDELKETVEDFVEPKKPEEIEKPKRETPVMRNVSKAMEEKTERYLKGTRVYAVIYSFLWICFFALAGYIVVAKGIMSWVYSYNYAKTEWGEHFQEGWLKPALPDLISQCTGYTLLVLLIVGMIAFLLLKIAKHPLKIKNEWLKVKRAKQKFWLIVNYIPVLWVVLVAILGETVFLVEDYDAPRNIVLEILQGSLMILSFLILHILILIPIIKRKKWYNAEMKRYARECKCEYEEYFPKYVTAKVAYKKRKKEYRKYRVDKFLYNIRYKAYCRELIKREKLGI